MGEVIYQLVQVFVHPQYVIHLCIYIYILNVGSYIYNLYGM